MSTPASRFPVLQTPLCDLLGVEYPIVQTGMGWVSGATLTAATSDAGGFGILASATMTLDELKAAIAKVKARTSRPFGVNMRGDQVNIEQYIELLVSEQVKVASFASPPPRPVIDTLKKQGILVIPTVGAPRHAQKMQEWGVDAVIAQGHEGGGHTGPIATSLLLPQTVAAVDIPVIGAGGFSSGQGLIAALSYGAAGIAMGTRFLLTRESGVPDHVKEVYLNTNLRGTVVTSGIDGHPQRVIATPVIAELESAGPLRRILLAGRNARALSKETGTGFWALLKEGLSMKKSQDLSLGQLMLAANAPMLTKSTMVDGDLRSGIMPTGQVVGTIDQLPAVADLLQTLMAEATSTLERLSANGGDAAGRQVA